VSLDVFGLCLGANVFGWTADEAATFAVLDRYAEAGGDFVDTANQYSFWAPGNHGGESETLIGRWFARSGRRDEIKLATKVGGEMPALPWDLRADTIRRALEESLVRLQTDRVDLYYAHFDDVSTPLEETLEAFSTLVREGKVRWVGFSNYTPERLAEAVAISEREGFEPISVLQPKYNLVERGFEAELQGLCERHGIAAVPYYGVALGFLTGKYRPGVTIDSPRAGRGAAAYLENPGAMRVLAVLDELSAQRGAAHATIALAWLRSRSTVLAPIASARDVAQLDELLAVAQFELSGEEVERLDTAYYQVERPPSTTRSTPVT
jgi:aryl-alcohol dehydrogenase-like predicted oxidoreductase